MKFEGWNYIMEFFGTFLLLLTILMSQNNPLAVGLAVGIIVWFGRSKSGAHINPAVSLSNFLAGKLGLSEFIGYVAAQVAGAVSCLYAFKTFF